MPILQSARLLLTHAKLLMKLTALLSSLYLLVGPIVATAQSAQVTLITPSKERVYQVNEKGKAPYLSTKVPDGAEMNALLEMVSRGDDLVKIIGPYREWIGQSSRGILTAYSDSTRAIVFIVDLIDSGRFTLQTIEGHKVTVNGDGDLSVADAGASAVALLAPGFPGIAGVSTKARVATARKCYRDGEYARAKALYKNIPVTWMTADDSAAYAFSLLETYDDWNLAPVISPRGVEEWFRQRTGSSRYADMVHSIGTYTTKATISAGTWRQMGAWLAFKGDWKKREHLLRRGLDRHPTDDSLALLVAGIAREADNFTEVIKLLGNRPLTSQTPRGLAQLLAQAYRMTENMPEAVRLGQVLVASDSSDLDSYYDLMIALDHLDRRPEATLLADAAVRHETARTPTWVRSTARYFLAAEAYKAKRHGQGLRLADEGIAFEAEDADLYVIKGDLLAAMNRAEGLVRVPVRVGRDDHHDYSVMPSCCTSVVNRTTQRCGRQEGEVTRTILDRWEVRCSLAHQLR